FNNEGRVLAAEFKDIIIASAYFPNSQDGGKRLDFKLSFCEAIHEWLLDLKKTGKIVVLGGDYNIAPFPIDLARPDDNEKSPGYLPEERAWMKSFLESGWVDSYRFLHPESVKYSWWSARTRARERNIGWRIDFHVLPEEDRDRIIAADIENEVLGSDHCPINLEIRI
ncbi:MAG: exodeoxyribonuclease III, partial [SAR324 cluster bacterium]|nr:exodeoxyribonuclease III [SAR324 cluster bacterium]